MSQLKAIFIICLFLTPNLAQVMGSDSYGNTNKTFYLTQTSYSYSVGLSRNNIQKGGVFSVFLSLRKGSSPLNFSYPYYSFKTYSTSNNITFSTANKEIIFGSLYPGENITIVHEVAGCVSASIYSLDFNFKIRKDTLANLNFSLVILHKGKDNSCNQLIENITPDDFWIFIFTSIIIIAIIILYIKKRKKINNMKSN